MKKFVLPLILVFLFTNTFFIAGKQFLLEKGFEPSVLLVGNLILFTASFVSFLVVQKGITGKNNSAFIRSVYGGFVGKLMVILAGMVIYIVTSKVNKPSLIALAFLYLVYTTAEVAALMKLNSAQKNA
ncbi:MAG: hypothetical protein JNM68_05960 [Dinghuibacter sp.]|nr:hypothetical protein [Dinghuibacter sp.]